MTKLEKNVLIRNLANVFKKHSPDFFDDLSSFDEAFLVLNDVFGALPSDLRQSIYLALSSNTVVKSVEGGDKQ